MNKKIIVAVLPLLIAVNQHVYSQDPIFKAFKFDIAGLIDIPLNNDGGIGGGFALEPRYSINDNFVMGIRFEGIYFNDNEVSADISFSGISAEVEQSNMYAVLLTGDYYFSFERVRPFIGMGMGIYRENITTTTSEVSALNGIGADINKSYEKEFGISPRIGVNISHFKLAGILNITGRDIPNYFGLQVGIEIGGGYD